MLADKTGQQSNLAATAGPDAINSGRPRLNKFLSRAGLGLLIGAVTGWILAFPTFQLLHYSFTGDRQLFVPTGQLNPVVGFCLDYRQVL